MKLIIYFNKDRNIVFDDVFTFEVTCDDNVNYRFAFDTVMEIFENYEIYHHHHIMLRDTEFLSFEVLRE